MSGLSTAERTILLVRCSSCGQGTDKSLAWLLTGEPVHCMTPGCGKLINLDAVENRIPIDEAAEYARRADARLSEIK